MSDAYKSLEDAKSDVKALVDEINSSYSDENLLKTIYVASISTFADVSSEGKVKIPSLGDITVKDGELETLKKILEKTGEIGLRFKQYLNEKSWKAINDVSAISEYFLSLTLGKEAVEGYKEDTKNSPGLPEALERENKESH